MELRHLRYFVAVAETGNVTRAAERLGIQQPPLSQQLKALETELGVQLLRRLPRGVELTVGGRTFLRDAREILADVESATARAARTARGIVGRVTIGLTSSASAHALAPALIRAFRAGYPAVDIEHSEGNAAALTEGVAAGTVDVALLRAPVSYPPGLAFHRLLDERMLAILPAGHPLVAGRAATQTSIRLRSLRGEAFILVRRPGAPGMYADLLAACDKLGFAPRIFAEVEQMLTNISLVAAGVGVSVVPASMRGVHARSVAYRTLRDAPQLVAPMTLVCRRAEVNPAVANLIALARKMAKAPADRA